MKFSTELKDTLLPQLKATDVVSFLSGKKDYIKESKEQLSKVKTQIPGYEQTIKAIVKESPVIAEKVLEALNPGTTFISPELKKIGVPSIIAGGIGLGIDILTPGPGELGKAKKIVNPVEDYLTNKVSTSLNKTKLPLKEKMYNAFNKFYTDVVDRFSPITKITNKAKTYGEILPSKDPELLARTYLGVKSKAEHCIVFNPELFGWNIPFDFGKNPCVSRSSITLLNGV